MKKYTLRIVPCNNKVAELYRNHTHYNEGDSGIDLFAPTELLVKSGKTEKLSFDISCELICEDGDRTYNVSYLMLPRSSIHKTNLRLANSVGLIDAFYRGPISAALDNIKETDYIIKENTRLFQLVTPDLTPFYKVEIVEKFLDASKNRKGGYGSTNGRKNYFNKK